MPNPKKNKKNKKSNVRIILYSSFLAMLVGFIFAILFYIGESFNFLPVIMLGDLPFGRSGDTIIIFTIALTGSVFISSLILFHLIKKDL